MNLTKIVKSDLSKISITRHPIDKKEIMLFIEHYFPIICEKLKAKINIKFDSKNNSNYTIFAINNNIDIVFFMESIYKLVSIFETKSARKAWILMLIVHELYHTVSPFKKKDFKSEIEYENYINEQTIDWVHNYYPNFIFNLKSEYNRWGKNNINGIWFTLSFGMVEKWRNNNESEK